MTELSRIGPCQTERGDGDPPLDALDVPLRDRNEALSAAGFEQQHLVTFSCKGRGFCPSCLGRRMCQTATNLIEHVLPPVPLRQWVLTLWRRERAPG
jgi:hypothetical protein